MQRFKIKRTIAVLGLAVGLLAGSPAMATEDVTIAVNISLDSLDPYNTNSTLAQAVGKSYYEGLFMFDKDLKIQPLLATGYEASEDGLTYTIKLRDGVKFQDGTDFNADAVKVNLERVLDKSNGLARYNQFSRIEKVDVVDPLTVKITLKEPFSAFINSLAHPSAMMISPTALKKWGKDITFHPTGTGPFEFVEWKPATYLKVKKFDGYWQKGYPKIDTLTFRTVTDNNTRAAMVQTGEAQFAFPLPFEQAKLLEKNDKLKVVAAPSIIARYISMNVQHKPFDDVRVRQAINYAINKEALAKVAFAGYAFPSQGVIPQGVQYAKKMDPWPYDPKKAKELLKEAGYADGFSTQLWSAYNDGTSAKVVQFLQQQLGQVGIKASVELLESGQRVQRVQQAQDPKTAPVRMYYAGWSASTGEADWALRPLLATSGWPPVFNNTAYYSNPEVDEDIKNALLTTDDAEKTKLYADAQDRIWKDAPWAFLVTMKLLSAQSKNLTGFNVMPDGSFQYKDVDLKP
ncbi:glutathione ABC transporter substrate-binding protein GsiB [Allopusillimonas soli]|uniref:Glutathione-binding protein GsiB n=2 Tax=Allopusillimonas soli TaxID=659016 RepID=A0A853F9U8_9BURK|nr:glutathione ABC transporter substrate-binding protein GsiB [Allopusillimonas soli]NYT35371.1 glutathione ABC transporter substrate-binding protein GsiB [Allopusillimonas soli]TEA75788.1 glutathione ABC transporter substrate-binding protein GsiB [Allopusillimonas soli]